jgi:hypothetical protein
MRKKNLLLKIQQKKIAQKYFVLFREALLACSFSFLLCVMHIKFFDFMKRERFYFELFLK